MKRLDNKYKNMAIFHLFKDGNLGGPIYTQPIKLSDSNNIFAQDENSP